jgi:hypothetical protein
MKLYNKYMPNRIGLSVLFSLNTSFIYGNSHSICNRRSTQLQDEENTGRTVQ